jgi:hypothetical protein
MKKILFLLAAAACICLTRCTDLTAAPTPQEAGRTAADEWLVLVDAQKYVESWQKLDPAFAKKVGKKKWTSSMTEIRERAGKLTSRKFNSAEYSKELPGAPEGEYVIVEFDCTFEKKKTATERVTLILGRDLYWRVAGYAVK